MKITRQDAYEILEVEEGADHTVIKKAYFKKSKEWHPDKRSTEDKEEATEMFQKISAAYQKLSAEDDEEEEGSDGEEFDMEDDIMFEFFAYMQAKMAAHKAQRAGRRGGGFAGFDSFGHGMGGMGGIPIPTPFGFMFMGGPAMGGPGFFSGHGGGGGGSGKPHQPRGGNQMPPRYQQQRGQQYELSEEEDEWETDSDYTSMSDDDDYYERQRERAFFRMRADERAREQIRVRTEYEAVMRQARETTSRDRAWLQQLARPVRVSFTDTSMVLSVDRGKSRMGSFADGELPEQFYWELQYRPLPAGHHPGEWQTLRVETLMEVEIQGLNPGTKYSFRARTCKREASEDTEKEECGEDTEKVECGDWSVESNYVTAGAAPSRVAAAPQAAPPAPGTGKKARRRTEARPQPARPALNEEAAREAELERQRAKEEKDAAIKAAIEAAAADYAKHATNAAPQRVQQAQQGAGGAGAGAGAGKKAIRKKGKKASAGAEESETSEALSRTTSTMSTPQGSAPPASEPRASTANGAVEDAGDAQWQPRYDADHPAAGAARRWQQLQQRGSGGGGGGGLGAFPAMMAPTRAPPRAAARPPAGAAPGAFVSRPSQAGAEAASGNEGARARLTREAESHGMTVEQYVAHQEDLALQEAIELSLALEASRKLLEEEACPPPEADDGQQFTTLPVQPPASALMQHHAYQQSPVVAPAPTQLPPPPPQLQQPQPLQGRRGALGPARGQQGLPHGQRENGGAQYQEQYDGLYDRRYRGYQQCQQQAYQPQGYQQASYHSQQQQQPQQPLQPLQPPQVCGQAPPAPAPSLAFPMPGQGYAPLSYHQHHPQHAYQAQPPQQQAFRAAAPAQQYHLQQYETRQKYQQEGSFYYSAPPGPQGPGPAGFEVPSITLLQATPPPGPARHARFELVPPQPLAQYVQQKQQQQQPAGPAAAVAPATAAGGWDQELPLAQSRSRYQPLPRRQSPVAAPPPPPPQLVLAGVPPSAGPRFRQERPPSRQYEA